MQLNTPSAAKSRPMSVPASFRECMQEHGLEPPEIIVPGKLHRFPTNGKRGDDAGWCRQFSDGQAGVFGCWRSGLSGTWFATDTPSQASRAETQAAITAMKAEREAHRALVGAETARKAKELWLAGSETKAHPYLLRKGVVIASTAVREVSLAAAVEVLGYAPWARNEALQGRLLVLPVQRDGAMVTAELIDETGRKSALRGEGTRSGSFWAAQPMPEQAERLIIGEGAATAASCAMATGWLAVAALSLGNLKKVCEAMRQRYPGADIVLAADIDKVTGEPMPQAVEAARAVKARVAIPVFRGTRREGDSDFNDVHQGEGLGGVKTALEAAKALAEVVTLGVAKAAQNPAETQLPPPARFPLLQREGILAMPPLTWRIHGLLPSVGIGLLYGPWGSAKSLLALDLAAALAGIADSWFGLPIVEHCPAVICAFEGQAGYRNRVRAWESHHRCELPANVMFTTPADFSLLHKEDTIELAATIRKSAPGAVVFLDTLAQGAPGLNENDSSQVGVVLHNLQRMAQIVAGLVIAVHHTGKDATRGPRGYSSMEPAADVVLSLDKTEGLRNWKAPKVKEGEAVGEKPFRLAQIDLGLDGYGQPVTSVAIAPEEPGAPFAPPRRYPTTSNQKIAWDAVGKALVESVEFGRADAPVHRPCITLTAAHAVAAACMPQPTAKDRNLAARRAIDAMTANGVFAVKNGWLWLP